MGMCDAAVVATVRVTVAVAPNATDAGEGVQVDSDGAPVQLTCTVWLKPPCGVSVKAYFAEEPGLTEVEPGVAASVKSAPVPVSAKLVWPATALFVMVSVAVRGPAPAGVNVELIVQVAAAPTALVQELLSEKSFASAPLIAIAEIVKEAFPEFVRVTFDTADADPTFWLLNMRAVGLKAICAPSPVPVRLTICGLPVALSMTFKDALSAPTPPGWNVTLIAQDAAGATGVEQLLV